MYVLSSHLFRSLTQHTNNRTRTRRNLNHNPSGSHSQRWLFSEPQHSDDDAKRTLNAFLVDGPEDPLSDLGSQALALVLQ